MTYNPKFTPGPWAIEFDEDIPGYREADRVIAGKLRIFQHRIGSGVGSSTEESANAQLIAEFPAMHKLLFDIRDWLECNPQEFPQPDNERHDFISQITALLEKVEA